MRIGRVSLIPNGCQDHGSGKMTSLSWHHHLLLLASLAIATGQDGKRLCREREDGRKCAKCLHQLSCVEACGCQSASLDSQGDSECPSRESLACAAKSCCGQSGGASSQPASARSSQKSAAPASRKAEAAQPPPKRGRPGEADDEEDEDEEPKKPLKQRLMGRCDLGGDTRCAEHCGCHANPQTSRLDCPTPTEVACLQRACCKTEQELQQQRESLTVGEKVRFSDEAEGVVPGSSLDGTLHVEL